MFVRHWDLRVWNPEQRTYTVNGRVIARYDANGRRITRWRLIRREADYKK